MEYVDNSLDCADEITRSSSSTSPTTSPSVTPAAAAAGAGANSGAKVHIAIDHTRRSVWIRDNCAGMSQQFLADLVCGIGESMKERTLDP